MPEARDDGASLKHNPDPYMYSKMLDSMSAKNRMPSFSMSKTARFPAPKPSAAGSMGPGHYRSECCFVSDSSEEIQSGRLTRSRSVCNYTFGTEDRRAECGALKGNSPTAGGRVPNPVSPSTYTLPRNSVWRYASPAYTVPRARTHA
mmetsp:Transcript_93555/g.243968  ORF Transcript_93555/g.243968 Transcript_93555/m.243968 type:complete len:147 (+) Transcript_93555:40-480(+)